MTEIKLLSWNTNGIRAIERKKVLNEMDFFMWLEKEQPLALCIQETKASEEQVSKKLLNPAGYYSYWSSAERKGYSGVVTYTKEEPLKVGTTFGFEEFDSEGRHVITEFPKFVLINSYFPNGKMSDERLDYKMRYYEEFLNYINALRKNGKSVIFCGDVNTAHKEIDLTHPKANETISGFLPVERAWIDKVIEQGYLDTFRHFHPDKTEQYTWWSMRNIGAREKNVGWRLDYFFVSNDLKNNLIDSYILPNIVGSDHCPVGLTLKF